METATILKIKIHKINALELIEKSVNAIRSDQKLKVFHLNVHAFNIAFKDAEFKKIINEGDIVFCDGFGVKAGAKILGLSIGERMTPPDWIDDLCKALAQNNQSVYLLGDEEGIAVRCASKFLEKNPTLKIAGTHHGFFKKEGFENDKVIKRINEANPDVLLVGFGMPLQEKWISANFANIRADIFISVGAMFRWIVGEEKRAPQFLASNGFEGIWRLFTQPGKVWKRYILEVPYFFLKVFYFALKSKLNYKSEDIKINY